MKFRFTLIFAVILLLDIKPNSSHGDYLNCTSNIGYCFEFSINDIEGSLFAPIQNEANVKLEISQPHAFWRSILGGALNQVVLNGYSLGQHEIQEQGIVDLNIPAKRLTPGIHVLNFSGKTEERYCSDNCSALGCSTCSCSNTTELVQGSVVFFIAESTQRTLLGHNFDLDGNLDFPVQSVRKKSQLAIESDDIYEIFSVPDGELLAKIPTNFIASTEIGFATSTTDQVTWWTGEEVLSIPIDYPSDPINAGINAAGKVTTIQSLQPITEYVDGAYVDIVEEYNWEPRSIRPLDDGWLADFGVAYFQISSNGVTESPLLFEYFAEFELFGTRNRWTIVGPNSEFDFFNIYSYENGEYSGRGDYFYRTDTEARHHVEESSDRTLDMCKIDGGLILRQSGNFVFIIEQSYDYFKTEVSSDLLPIICVEEYGLIIPGEIRGRTNWYFIPSNLYAETLNKIASFQVSE